MENLPLERVISISRKGSLPSFSSSDEKEMLGCWLSYLNRQHPNISFSDQFVRHFLNNLFEPKPPLFTAPKKIVYFLPSFYWTGSHSLQIRTQITRLCRAAYPHLNIHFVFRSSTRISSFFPFKDKVPKFLRSGVVYLFKCRCCSASYVGQTTRHLHTRVYVYLNTWAPLL